MPLPIGCLTVPDAIEAWAGRYLDAAVRRGHLHSAHGHELLGHAWSLVDRAIDESLSAE